MPSIRVTGAQISRPARVRFSSQGVYIQGMQEIFEAATKRMQAIIDRTEGAVAEGIYEAAKPIYELSQTYVPVHTGKLKQSGFLEVQRRGTRVAIGYGRGGHPWYAAYVHEATWIYHRAPTRAKFLEAAVNERIHVFTAILRQSVQKAVGSAGRVR